MMDILIAVLYILCAAVIFMVLLVLAIAADYIRLEKRKLKRRHPNVSKDINI